MKNTNRLKKSLSAIALLLFWNSTIAQESLSLSEAIALGLSNNFSIQIEKQKQAQAVTNNTWGQAGMFPNISLRAVPGARYSDSDNPLSFAPGATANYNINPTISADWVIFNGFNVRITKGKLGLLQDQSDGNAMIVIENTVQAVILAYYNVLLEEKRTEVFANTLNLSRDRYDYVKLKGDLGSAVTFDILRDKNAYLTDSSNYLTQVVNHKNAQRNFNLLLGENINTNYDFTDSLSVHTKQLNLDELAATMKASNSNLKNQYINQEIFRKDIGLAKSAIYPSIRLNLSGVQSWNQLRFNESRTDQSGDTYDQVNSNTLNIMANMTLSFTLFNGGKVKSQIKNAKIQEQIGQLKTRDLELTLDNSLVNTHDRYNLRQNLNGIADVNLETANLNLDMGEEHYRNGSINSFNYRNLQITYLQTALVYYQSIYNMIESKTELLRLTGGILSEN